MRRCVPFDWTIHHKHFLPLFGTWLRAPAFSSRVVSATGDDCFDRLSLQGDRLADESRWMQPYAMPGGSSSTLRFARCPIQAHARPLAPVIRSGPSGRGVQKCGLGDEVGRS